MVQMVERVPEIVLCSRVTTCVEVRFLITDLHESTKARQVEITCSC